MILLHCDESVKLCKFCNFIAPSLAILKDHVFTHVKCVAVEHCEERSSVEIGSASSAEVFEDGTVSPMDTGNDMIHCKESGETSSPHNTTDTSSGHSQMNVDKSSDSHEDYTNDSEHQDKTGQSGENDADKKFSCSHCDFMTNSKDYYDKHINQHRLPVLKIPSAKGCAPETTSRRSPNLEHHQPDDRSNKCLQCNIVFMSRQNFLAHKQFYCASRHSETPTSDMTTPINIKVATPFTNTSSLSPIPESSDESSPQMKGGPAQRSGRSSTTSSHTSPSPRTDPHNTSPHPSSNSSHSTLSPLPTMVQISSASHAPVASQSTSPSPTFVTAPSYIIPAPSVLSGMSQQGAPVLLVAVPYPASSLRHPGLSLVQTANPLDDKPLDLSVKTSRDSPSSSPTAMDASSPRSSLGDDQAPAAVIDLARTVQSNALSSPPLQQFNECKKCDIVFNKYESLLAHKQYYCASRHIRGKQIEMSYMEGNVSPVGRGNQAGTSRQQVYVKHDEAHQEPPGISSSERTDSDEPHNKIDTGLQNRTDNNVTIKQEPVDSPDDVLKATVKEGNSNNGGCHGDIGNHGDRSGDEDLARSDTLENGSIARWMALKSPPPPTTSQDDTKPSAEPSSSKHGDGNNAKDRGQSDVEKARGKPSVESRDRKLEMMLQVPNAILHVPILEPRRPYSCQDCSVSFMKIESLEVHRKFYCAARKDDNSSPQTLEDRGSSSHMSVDGCPKTIQGNEKDESTKGLPEVNGDTVVHRTPLLCKGCNQYFSTSKQIRRHSCKNGALGNMNSSNMTGVVVAQKRSSNEEKNIETLGKTNMEDSDVPPSKRCKGETVNDSHNLPSVVVKQERMDTSECETSVNDHRRTSMNNDSDSHDENVPEQSDASITDSTQVKCEQESMEVNSCHNGAVVGIKEEPGTHQTPQSCNDSKVVQSGQKSDNSGRNVDGTNNKTANLFVSVQDGGHDSGSSSKIYVSNDSVRQDETNSITNKDSDLKHKLSHAVNLQNSNTTNTIGDAKLTSSSIGFSCASNLSSSRGRVIQHQPQAKHCSTCNIDFNSLSNFIAHKKYYCSARQQAKS